MTHLSGGETLLLRITISRIMPLGFDFRPGEYSTTDYNGREIVTLGYAEVKENENRGIGNTATSEPNSF